MEESVEESVEAVVPEQAETTDDTQQSDSVSILKNMMENAKENQPQSFQLKNGSVNYDPASGEVTVMDLNQQQTATLSLPAGAQVFASDVTLAAIVPDEQAQTVTLTLYSVEDSCLTPISRSRTATRWSPASGSTGNRWRAATFCRRSTGWNFPPIRSTLSRGMSRGIRSTT